MKTTNLESVLNVWNITDDAEKRTIMSQFIKKHGDFYTHDEFMAFLARKYKKARSADTLPITGRRQEH